MEERLTLILAEYQVTEALQDNNKKTSMGTTTLNYKFVRKYIIKGATYVITVVNVS